MHPEIPVLSFISAALSVVPLVWYLQARNLAAVAIGIWLSVTHLTYTTDALIWAEDADIKASLWCDISTGFITGSRIALAAASLSICIHLERLASFSQTSTLQANRRRIIFECSMCFGLPLLYIALHLLVQPRRFDVFYGFGCRPATYPTIATIFLVMIPPLCLTVATIICAGMAWRHFVVHGIHFYGRRSSVSSLTRSLYLRLVAMALLEAVLSAVLIAIVMWGVLTPGLVPIGKMPRDLNEVLVQRPEAITGTIRTVLQVEWLVNVLQSAGYFGLFACRMEVVREGWEVVRSFLQSLRMSLPFVMPERGTSPDQSSTSATATVPTVSLTEVDLSLVIYSPSTLTPDGQSIDKSKSFPLTPNISCPPSIVEDVPQDPVITDIAPAMIPLESPSRASVIASSHNSLESNFDPSWLLSPGVWPKTPTSIPVCLPRHFLDVGLDPEESWLDVDVPFPQAKVATHVRSNTFFGRLPVHRGPEKRHAIYVTVVNQP